MPTQLARQAFGFAIDSSSRVLQMYRAAVKLNGRDLVPGGAFGNDGNKGQAYQPCEISFGHGRGARGGLDDGTVRMQPAITKRIQEEGARQAMLQTAGRVAGLVFQIKIDSRICRQMQRDQMRVGRSEEHTSELQSLMRI